MPERVRGAVKRLVERRQACQPLGRPEAERAGERRHARACGVEPAGEIGAQELVHLAAKLTLQVPRKARHARAKALEEGACFPRRCHRVVHLSPPTASFEGSYHARMAWRRACSS